MTQIGSFIRTADGFQGHLKTLTLNVDLCLVPADASEAENAPDFRVHLGADDQGLEVGAGWKRTGERAGAYVSIALDDPTFAQPVHANLFQSGRDGNDHFLVWNRPARREPRS